MSKHNDLYSEDVLRQSAWWDSLSYVQLSELFRHNDDMLVNAACGYLTTSAMLSNNCLYFLEIKSFVTLEFINEAEKIFNLWNGKCINKRLDMHNCVNGITWIWPKGAISLIFDIGANKDLLSVRGKIISLDKAHIHEFTSLLEKPIV